MVIHWCLALVISLNFKWMKTILKVSIPLSCLLQSPNIVAWYQWMARPWCLPLVLSGTWPTNPLGNEIPLSHIAHCLLQEPWENFHINQHSNNQMFFSGLGSWYPPATAFLPGQRRSLWRLTACCSGQWIFPRTFWRSSWNDLRCWVCILKPFHWKDSSMSTLYMYTPVISRFQSSQRN